MTVNQKLDETQLQRFERDGYVVLGQILDEDECARLVAEERRLRLDGGYGTSAHLVVMDQIENVSEAVREFCCGGRHLDAVAQLLGPDVALTHNQFVTKLPGSRGDSSSIPLHQDNGYGTLDPPVDVTVWVALTDATISNGCLVIAPGSHRLGLVEHRVGVDNPAFREADGVVDVVPLELESGRAVAFSGLLLHGSLENVTDADRPALFARYCRPDATMSTEGGRPVLDDPHSWMVRGEAPIAQWRSANSKFLGS